MSLFRLTLEPMALDHLDEVMEIEKVSFPEPYSRELFEEELALKVARLFVVKYQKKIIGFIDYWIVKDEIQLINIAVDPLYRKQKVGAFLMKHLDQVAEANQVKKVFLDVRESNVAAIHLYKKFGYEKIRVRKKYYSDNNENAWVMVKEH